VKAVSQSEVGFWDLLEAFQTVSAELARFKDVSALADSALQLALELTKSAVAFIGLVDTDGLPTQVFSRSADASDGLPSSEVERIVAAAAAPASATANTVELNWTRYTNPGARVFRSYCGHPLNAGGKVIGMVGVASPNGYTDAQRRAFAIFANQVAAALEIALLEERRKEMVDTLVNLRQELDRSERQRLINDEMARSAWQLVSALLLATALAYMLLAALFNSLIYPLTIMLCLPMALVGAIVGLTLAGESLNVVSMIGIIMLVGLVSKNAILLVDYTNTLRGRGLERDEAVRMAASVDSSADANR